jgi:hypothetical protein
MPKSEWSEFMHRLKGRGYVNNNEIESILDPETGVRTGGNFAQRFANKSRQQAVLKGYLPDQYRGYTGGVSPAQLARLQKFGPVVRVGQKRLDHKVLAPNQFDTNYEEPAGNFFGLGQQQRQAQAQVQAQVAAAAQAQVQAQVAAAAQAVVDAGAAARGYAFQDLPACCYDHINPDYEGRPSYPCPSIHCENGQLGPVKADGSVYMVITAKNGVKRWQHYKSMDSALAAKAKFGYV